MTELLQPQPGRQRQPAHRVVTGKLPAGEPAIRAAIRRQPRQALQEQGGEVRFQVPDPHMRLRAAAAGQIHRHLPAGPVEQRPGRLIGERFCRRVPLGDRPPVKHRQHADMPVPGARREPLPGRAGPPELRVSAQGLPQPVPGIEQPHAAGRQELQPFPDHTGIRRPRGRRGCPADRQLPQPLIHHARRARPPRLVLQQQVVIDQYRHPLGNQRPVLKAPRLPAPGREERQDHEG